jgi:pimeloyl-ACP methyl ester carboxylesterase
MGGTASLVAGEKAQAMSSIRLAGIATLSAPVEFMGLDARSAVPQVSVPKLFLAAEKDVGAAGARELNRLAPPPKTLVLYPGSDHGTALLTGSNGIAVADRITSFLQSAFSRP